MTIPSKRHRQILEKLTDGERWREDEIKSSHNFLQQMFFSGWIDGAGYQDAKGTGNYPRTRVWWITDSGRAAVANRAGV